MVLSVAISYATHIPIRCEARLLSRVQVRNCFKATMRPSHFKKTRRHCCSKARSGCRCNTCRKRLQLTLEESGPSSLRRHDYCVRDGSSEQVSPKTPVGAGITEDAVACVELAARGLTRRVFTSGVRSGGGGPPPVVDEASADGSPPPGGLPWPSSLRKRSMRHSICCRDDVLTSVILKMKVPLSKMWIPNSAPSRERTP